MSRNRIPNRKARAFLRSLWAVPVAMLAACEPNPPPGSTGMLDVRSPTYTEEGVQGCHLCHAGEFNRSLTDTAHGDPQNPATPYAQHGCESCHGPGSFHVSRAHGGKGVPKMITFGFGPGASLRDEQLAACQGCHHPDAAGAAAIEFAGSSHDSRFVNCSTCHEMHAREEPLSLPTRQAEICLECHRSLRDTHPQVRGQAVNFDLRLCSDCHAVHPVTMTAEELDFDF